MRQIVLAGSGWVSGPVLLAERFVDRLRGLRGRPEGAGLLIKTPTVHGFGMSRPLWVVGLSGDLVVVGVKQLFPNRVVGFRSARYLLELPVTWKPPPPGTRLVIDD